MTRRRGGFGSRIADGSLSEVLGREGTPIGVEDLPNYIDVPVTDAWRRFVEQYAVDIPRLTGTRVQAKEAVLTLSLETLLGIQSGPGPTPGSEDVTIVGIKDGLAFPITAADAIRITTGGEALPVAITDPLNVRISGQAQALSVAAAITGRGTAAGQPLYVNVVNQSPAGSQLEPSSAKIAASAVKVATGTSTNGSFRCGPATFQLERDVVARFTALYGRARSLEINAQNANLDAWYEDIDPPSGWIVASSGEREAFRLVGPWTQRNTRTGSVLRQEGSIMALFDTDTGSTTAPAAQIDVDGGWRPIAASGGTAWTVLGFCDYIKPGLVIPSGSTMDLALHFDLLGTPATSEGPSRGPDGRFKATERHSKASESSPEG